MSYFYSTWQQSSCLFRILVNIQRKLYILKGKSAFHFEYKLDHLVLTNHLPEIYWTLIFNVEKWTNILKISWQCHNARLLKYIWPFFNIMHERVNVILVPVLFKNSALNVGRKWQETDSITLKKQKLLPHYWLGGIIRDSNIWCFHPRLP